MRILWICALPKDVQRTCLRGEDHGAHVDCSWIIAHLPPPTGVDLHIATVWPGGDRRKSFQYKGATFHLIPCPRKGRALLFFLRDRSFFGPLYSELNPSVVHGWGTEDSFGLVARQLAPRNHVIGIQGLIAEYSDRVKMPLRCRITRQTERWTLSKARCVVAESQYSLDAVRPMCPNARFLVVEHPLREEFLQSAPATGIGRRVLFLGEINERKGILHALESFAAASDESWFLHVVGRGSESEERSMKIHVQRLGFLERFHHDPSLTAADVVTAMRTSAVFLLPTRIDTGPTALKEALTMGLWPVCFDNSGPAEYIRRFGFGSLARDQDREDLTVQLSAALRELPWMNPPRRAELRAASVARFSPNATWDDLIRLYGEIA